MKYQLCCWLCVCATITTVVGHTQAEIIEFEFTGMLTAIMDSNGNSGGAFTLSENAGIAVGDTYHGTIQWDTGSNESISDPVPFATVYDYRPAMPTLTIDGISRLLTQKIGLTVIDNVDPDNSLLPNYFGFGMNQTGVDPQSAVDSLWFAGDVLGFDSTNVTGTEFILVTFDPTGLALSGKGKPDPLTLLSHTYFVLLETVNGVTTAAGIGTIPEPTTGFLFGAGILAVMGVGRKRS